MSDTTLQANATTPYRSAGGVSMSTHRASIAASWTFEDDEPWPAERLEISIPVSRALVAMPWYEPTTERAKALLELKPNWNGYGEQEVHPDSIKRLFAVLGSIGYAGEPPTVVPVSDGSVQIEWHRGPVSVEVLIPPHGPASGWFSSDETDEEWAINSATGVHQLRSHLKSLLDA